MEELTTKLCIIGGSGGGMTAALRAAECGVDGIVLLERNRMLGGCFRYVSGIFGAGTSMQERAGLDISVDACYRHHMNHCNWTADARLVRKWFSGTRTTLDWIETLGLKFNKLVAFSGTSLLFHQGGDPRYPVGTTLARLMEEKIRNTPGIRICMETRARKLLTDERGRVCGVIAEDRDGQTVRVNAQCVVLSTGSISNNPVLVKRFYNRDDYDRLKVMSRVPHNMGDGLLMAEEIGAASGNASCLYIGPHNHPHNVRTGLILRRSQVMKVNINGERFVDEACPNTEDWGWYMAVSVDQQPMKTVYALLDQGLLDRMVAEKRNQTAVEEFQGKFKSHDSTGDFNKENVVELAEEYSEAAWLVSIQEDMKEEAKAGRVLISDSLEEIAAWIGCDGAVLRRTVEDYNRYCAEGYDADFLKDPKYLQPFTRGPYYCMLSHSGVDTFIGGLRIDHNQRVLKKEDGKPIPGLYAAGVMTSGWLGQNYGYYGSESSYTLYSGYACGENAAAEIKAS